MILTLFHVLNVVALLGVLTYIFRTRLRMLLITAIERVHIARKQLHKDIGHAEQTYTDLQSALQAEHDFARMAHQRLQAWRAFEQAKEAEQRSEQESQVERVVEKQRRQAAYVQQYRVQMTLLPAAFEQATQQLEKKYRDPHAGASYLETITKELP